MKQPAILLFALSFLLAPPRAAEKERHTALFTRAVVTVEVTRRQYDYIQPWSKRVEHFQKTGIISGKDEILTTAEFLADQTLIRIQKGGRGKWWLGKVVWVDYYANLGIVRPMDPAFWNETEPLLLAETAPKAGDVELVRWRNGNLEIRKADINRAVVKRGKLSFVEHVQLDVDTEANGTGWGEAIVLENKLVGITSSKEEHGCTAIPSSFIRSCLENRQKSVERGLGFFAFVWERAENPETLEYLRLEGEPRGVIVISVPPDLGPGTVKTRDILLQIDGFDIDTEGDYNDPDYGHLSLENLASRQRWAGDTVKIKVWRDGKMMDVSYVLPKASYNVDLVPEELFDQEPEYVLLGGWLFQPLSHPFLRSWGADWSRKAPFRLSYYTKEKAKKDRPSLVILSLVLPDAINVGYQDARYLAVDRLNGQPIRRLADLLDAKKRPIDGFHILEFREGESVRRMVLDAREAESATDRILKRYNIENDHVIRDTLDQK